MMHVLERTSMSQRSTPNICCKDELIEGHDISPVNSTKMSCTFSSTKDVNDKSRMITANTSIMMNEQENVKERKILGENRIGQEDGIVNNNNSRASWKTSVHNNSTIEFLGRFLVVVWFLLLVNLIYRQMGLEQTTLSPFDNISRLWLCSLLGGYMAKQIHLPPLLGMLAAGLLGVNISDKLFGIPEIWRVVFTSAGLSIVLLRSGLELDLPSLGRSKLLALRLTLIPGIIEAMTSGFMAVVFFGMPIWLGLSLGFILAAVSPAVVVTSMIDLQHKGYGALKGIPSLIIAAASFDDIVAIGGFSICIGMAVQREDSSLIYSALHGPLSVVYGILIGTIAGAILSVTKLWNTTWKMTFMIVTFCLSTMFGMKLLNYSGSGAMGSMTIGIISSLCWSNNYPSIFAGSTNENTVKEVQNQVSLLWDIIVEPLLFGSIGCALDFDLISSASLTKGVFIVCIGSVFRLASAYLATWNGQLTPKERLFIALAWLPKATVQAALCTFPLLRVKQTLSPDDVHYNNYIKWTEQILSTAILSICITAPIGVISIKFLGKLLLRHDKQEVLVAVDHHHKTLDLDHDNDDDSSSNSNQNV